MLIDFWTFGVQSLVIRARMLTMRPFALRLVGLCLVLAVGGYVSPLSNGFASQNGRGGIEPILRLEKPRYIAGEAIRFWVGVKPKNTPTIPQELRKPCSLGVTKPDGTRRVQSVGWPLDGMVDQGWSGGWGLGDEKVEPGVYVLVLECAGEKTAPLQLIVEQSEILTQVKAQFRFERDGAITKSTHVPITLTVDNGSQATIRFPQRGAMMEGISLEIVRKDPVFHSALFFPWEKLSHSNSMPDTYGWDFPEIPSVTLKPGEHFEQNFLLEDAFSFDQAGDYHVTFTTVFSMLVGEKDGPFADVSPIKILATGSAIFVVTDADNTTSSR
jgi:hypothetical protein